MKKLCWYCESTYFLVVIGNVETSDSKFYVASREKFGIIFEASMGLIVINRQLL